MEKILKKDDEWSAIDGELCRVTEFIPFAKVENGRVISIDATLPYASVHVECAKLPEGTTGFIVHKLDFQHLWAAFRVRGVKPNEEVIFFWTKRRLKWFARLFAPFMPKLWVMICKEGAYELMTDPDCNPQLRGEARWNAEKPIVDWKPQVMD